MRLAANEAAHARRLTAVHVGDGVSGRTDHVTRSFNSAAHLAWRRTDRSADLPGDLCGNLAAARFEGRDEPLTDRGPLGDGHVAPAALGGDRALDRVIDLRRGGIRALHIDAAIDGRDRDLLRHADSAQMISK